MTDRTPCKWEKALHSLTPGGSEYVGDLDRMMNYIRDRDHRNHKYLIKKVLESRALESQNRQLVDALRVVLKQAGFDDPCVDMNLPSWVGPARALLAAIEKEAAQ